jgi:flagellar L-ring protein precursor FlgH
MKRALLAAVLLPLPCLCTAAEDANRPTGSLWSAQSRSLILDNRARKVGDTLTILVQESSSATSTAATRTSRSDSASFGGLTGGLKTLNRLLVPFGASGQAQANGQGATTRSGSVVTRLTAVVKEVLPNGNLVIEGVRKVGVNNEKESVTVTGVVRPQDISAENTVLSVQIANVTVQYDGKGPVGEKQRKGLLSTIFGWLF